MWAWFMALTRAAWNDQDGYPAGAERRVRVTRAELTRLFAQELSLKSTRR